MASVFERISKKRSDFSNSYRKVAEYLTEHYEEAAFMPAIQIGESAGVSESVVIRFAKFLGYAGFPELKKGLQKEIRKNMTPTQKVKNAELEGDASEKEVFQLVMTREYNNVLKTVKDPYNIQAFAGASDILEQADRIFVLAVRALEPAALVLENMLGMLGKRVICINPERSLDMQHILGAGERDACVTISFARYDKRVRRTQEYLRERGVRIVTVTDNPESPDVELAERTLYAGVESYSYTNSVCALFALFNALSVSIMLKNKDQAISNLELMENLGMLGEYTL